jgi:FKBP-type peptidyl-prolyl cis-trans isomerase FklB
MNSKLYALLALSLIAGNCFAQPGNPSARPQMKIGQPSNQTPPPKPSKDDLSYASGMAFAGTIKRMDLDVDLDIVVKAMKDVLAGTPTKLDEKKMNEIVQAAMYYAQQEMPAKNKKKADAFFAENAKKPGIKTLPGGLQYRVIKEGTGAVPKTNDIITAHYTGHLLNGTKFDSSYDHPGAEPMQRAANRLIPGWTEALTNMHVGSKWELFIPADLAYGEHGQGKIGPGEALIFEMELLDVKAPEAPAAPPAPAASAAKPNETVVSGEIIKVPSAEEMKKGAKIEVIKQSDLTNAVKATNAPDKK